jgi:hypothetical protein
MTLLHMLESTCPQAASKPEPYGVPHRPTFHQTHPYVSPQHPPYVTPGVPPSHCLHPLTPTRPLPPFHTTPPSCAVLCPRLCSLQAGHMYSLLRAKNPSLPFHPTPLLCLCPTGRAHVQPAAPSCCQVVCHSPNRSAFPQHCSSRAMWRCAALHQHLM